MKWKFFISFQMCNKRQILYISSRRFIQLSFHVNIINISMILCTLLAVYYEMEPKLTIKSLMYRHNNNIINRSNYSVALPVM